MPHEPGTPLDEGDVDDFEKRYQQLSESADAHKTAWRATLDDMERAAEEYEAEGWSVVTIPAQDAAPEARDSNDPDDRFGLSLVVPDNKATAFREAFEAGEFPEYDVYRGEANARVFMVIEYRDPETQTAIVVAANFWRRDANLMVDDAMEEGKMYTHYHVLGGDHLGSFAHDSVEKFFPEAPRVHDE